jgi:hypothetical protein
VGEDLAGYVDCLRGVVLSDAAWHEEALDKAEDCGNAGPEEDKVQDACGISAQVEVVNAEVAQEERKKKSGDLVFVGALIFGVEPGSLLVGHIGGVERVSDLHDFAPLDDGKGGYAARRLMVPLSGGCMRLRGLLRLDWSQFTRDLRGRTVSTIMMCDATARRYRESDYEKAGGCYAGSS